MPKNEKVCRPAAVRYVHMKAVDKHRAKLLEDQRHDEERRLLDELRAELEIDGRLPDWQVQHDDERDITAHELGQVVEE